jgi:hypothetical protein
VERDSCAADAEARLSLNFAKKNAWFRMGEACNRRSSFTGRGLLGYLRDLSTKEEPAKRLVLLGGRARRDTTFVLLRMAGEARERRGPQPLVTLPRGAAAAEAPLVVYIDFRAKLLPFRGSFFFSEEVNAAIEARDSLAAQLCGPVSGRCCKEVWLPQHKRVTCGSDVGDALETGRDGADGSTRVTLIWTMWT